MKKVKVGIIGGAGYTAGELIRLLLNHPFAEIVFAQSSSHSGHRVVSVHDDLFGETDLTFTDSFHMDAADVIFLCQGHGKSRAFMQKIALPSGLKVIDLSSDFRMKDSSHNFVYGLPELNRENIRSADFVANPGCFATAIQLALIPLANEGLLNAEVHVQAITGSTGAGQMPTETTHFSWREGNLSAYKIFEHQHQDEILQSIRQLQPGFNKDINFIPIRGNFTRGIFVSAYTEYDGSGKDAAELFSNYFATHPFTVVSENNPSLKQVINTNKALIYTEKHGSKLVMISCSDNMLKGASGQAIQNMNLMFGLDETSGLHLKPVAF